MRRNLLALGLLLVLPLVLFAPTVVSGALFLPQAPVGLEPLATEHQDLAAQAWTQANYLASDRLFPILTDELEIARQLREGHLPLWNAKQGLGLPLLGGTLVGPLYPPNWIAYATDPVRAAPLLAALSLFLAGLGAWLFLERRGVSFGSAAIGALAVQTGGFVLCNLHYRMKVDAALWLPWMLWAIDGIASKKPRASAALAFSVAASFLAGFPTIAAFAVGAAVVYALARRTLDRVKTLALSRCGAAVLCGVAIAAVQLVPTWDAARESLRGARTSASVAAESLPLGTALGLVVPDLFGSPNEPLAAPHLPVPWWLSRATEKEAAQNANQLEWQLYVGVAVLVLALAGCVAFPRDTRVLLGLAVGALAFVQGWPLARELFALPGLDVGAPARAACVLWIALPLCAGFGAEALWRRHPRALKTAAGVAVVLALVGAAFRATIEPENFVLARETEVAARHGVTLGEVRALLPHDASLAAAQRLAHASERLALVGLAAAAAAAFLHWSRRREQTRAPWLPLFAVILVEGVAGSGAHLVPRAASLGALFPKSESMEAIASAAGDGRVLRLDLSQSGVDDVLVLARPNLPEAYGLCDLTPYVVFSQRSLVELVQAIDPLASYRTGISRLSLPARVDHPVLDCLRVGALVSKDPLRLARLEPVLERDRFHVYRRDVRVAEARIVAPLAVADDAAALARLGHGDFDPTRESVIVAEPAAAPDLSGASVRSCRDDGAGRIEVEAHAPGGGWLVLATAYHPGWRVTIDGEPAPRVAPADHALLGIELPARAGLHVVAEFAPPSYLLAVVVSIAGLIAAFLLARGPRAVELDD
ncbi:MAG: hypothetical protein K8S98_16425 [Planctomycetes bacterium]|nr:hypothetical protein [Planctomycetota bacterium]